MIETEKYTIAMLAHDGPYENFLYLLTDKASGQSVAIDPAWDADWYDRMADQQQGKISAIWLTHSHGDHINAVDAVLARQTVPLYVSAEEADFWGGAPSDAVIFRDGDTLSIGETTAKVFVTPGHTPGSCCFLLDGHLIAGDTLFTWGCGRCDMEGGSPAQMFQSLARLGQEIPGHVQVLPGHDYGDQPSVTMDEQIAGNPFMLCKSVEDFTEYRMVLHDTTRESPYRAMRAEDLPV